MTPAMTTGRRSMMLLQTKIVSPEGSRPTRMSVRTWNEGQTSADHSLPEVGAWPPWAECSLWDELWPDSAPRIHFSSSG